MLSKDMGLLRNRADGMESCSKDSHITLTNNSEYKTAFATAQQILSIFDVITHNK